MYDVIVIGVGGMGSATTYHLARRGARVLGLEQFDIPHDRGSSHGVHRIIRLAYAESPRYVPLLHRAYELWRQLETGSRERLLFMTGGLDIGPPGSSLVARSRLSCEVHDLAHERLDAMAINRRFSGYELPPDFEGIFQPQGGFVLAERSVIAHVEQSIAAGADVRAREAVLDWDADHDRVTVRTSRDTYRARRLVITAGPWAANLMPRLQNLAVPERQVLLFTQPRHPERFRPDRFPIFIVEAPEGLFYGLPIYGVPGLKVGKYHHLHQRSAADAVDREVHDHDERALRAVLARCFPDADGPTLAMKTCIFTNTPDEHFILDRLADRPACVAAGFSGHGYKFCSVVGEIMADLAVDGGTRHDISMFQIQRFG